MSEGKEVNKRSMISFLREHCIFLWFRHLKQVIEVQVFFYFREAANSVKNTVAEARPVIDVTRPINL